jgi:hypothetical protein
VPRPPPTLKAFVTSASEWLKVFLWFRLRSIFVDSVFDWIFLFHWLNWVELWSCSGYGILHWRRKCLLAM